MKLKYLFVLYITLILIGCKRQKSYKPVTYPKNYKAQIDVVYKTVGDWEGKMDIYNNPAAKTPTPIILNIHGGGWSTGQKESQTDFGVFFENGYAVANTSYRLVDVAPAPAAIEDVRCALIYLFNNAEALNIDKSRVVIMGTSAGGHLALMAGLLGNNPIFDNDCSYENDIKIAGIIDIYGITDLVPISTLSTKKIWLADRFSDLDFVKSVSPLYYVSKESPPVFIAHGDRDEVVPYSQSTALQEALNRSSVKNEFFTIPDCGHGFLTQKHKTLLKENIMGFLKKIL
jgi:acetyl esterase/lipase